MESADQRTFKRHLQGTVTPAPTAPTAPTAPAKRAAGEVPQDFDPNGSFTVELSSLFDVC
jgi:hypothetical protein